MIRQICLFSASFFVGFAGIAISVAAAKDFGTRGKTWAIAEPDLLSTISGKLKKAEASGEFERMNKIFAAKAKAKVNRPSPVMGLGRTNEFRKWKFDPTITVDKDVRDTKGNVIARRGQRVNPLQFVSMSQKLIFIDGDEVGDLAWALKQGNAAKVKIVFVSGAPLEQMKKTNRRLYFDQTGALIKKFGIQNVPAMVKQDGQILEVSEIIGKPG